MKVLLVLCLTVALTQANIFDEIKEKLLALGKGFKETGTAFLPYAKTQAVDLLKNAGAGVVSALSNTLIDLIKNIGKRDSTHLDGTSLISRLKGLVNLGITQFSGAISKTFDEIEQLRTKLLSLIKHPQEVIQEVNSIIAKHTSLTTEFLQAIERDVNMIVSLFHHNKRSGVGDLLSSIGHRIVNLFKPGLNGVTEMVKKAGEVIKNAATHLLNSAGQPGNQLVHSLLGELGTIFQHGTEVLNAMKTMAGHFIGQTGP